ncbi:hypothetical protein [Acidithiobacillus ferrooxidans]|uniref:hypothetical protein n=1 Tax=Acidithiobacillus ferrooxidans TaxID=920 RepID=UPI000AFC4B83|nr:hypothetical protein [Acidithiobacillus ferrooxidans]
MLYNHSQAQLSELKREFDRDYYHDDDGYLVERMRVSADASAKTAKPAHRVQRVKGESKRSSAKSGDGNSDNSDDSDPDSDSDPALSTSTSSLSNTPATRREALQALHNLGHISESTLKISEKLGLDAADAWLSEHDADLQDRGDADSDAADVLQNDGIRDRHHGIKLPPRDSMTQPAWGDTPVPAIFASEKTDKKWVSDEQIARLCGANRYPDPTEALEQKQEIDAAKALMQERVAMGLLKKRDKKRVERVMSGWKIEEIAAAEGVTLQCVYTSLKKSAGEIAVGLEKRAAALAWAAMRDQRGDLPPLPELAAAVQVGLFDEFGGAE